MINSLWIAGTQIRDCCINKCVGCPNQYVYDYGWATGVGPG